MTTWQPLPLHDIGTTAEKATLLPRLDGHGLFYPGRIHILRGESEAHKTWLALLAVADTLNSGNRAVFIDFEDHAETIVTRLTQLGIHRDVINDPHRFAYIRPEESVDADPPWTDLYATLDLAPVALIVIDGVTESMTLEGLDLNSNRDVATWIARLPRQIADRTSAATVAIDHVTKAVENRGNYALGAQHKRAGVDVQYLVQAIRPLSPVTIGLEPHTGVLLLTIDKDRPGYVRSVSPDGKQAATVELTAWPDSNVTYQVSTSAVSRDYGLRKRIADLLRGAPGAPKRLLRDLGNSDAIDAAVAGMVEDGHVTIEIVNARSYKHWLTEDGNAAYPGAST